MKIRHFMRGALFLLLLTVVLSLAQGRDAKAASQWKAENGFWYLLDENGEKQTGWASVDGEWYYLAKDGKMLTGQWLADGGEWYYLRESGKAMRSAWMEEDGEWYYFRESGKMMRSSWLEYEGNWFYFRESGKMEHGAWLEYEGDWYYLNESGRMRTSAWLSTGNAWYYLGSGGKMVTGWFSVEEEWYYFRESGQMATGWTEVDGEWYHLRESGKMDTGWYSENEAWYYLRESGKMHIGWLEIEGEWYYFYGPSDDARIGTMAVSTEIDGYVLASDGTMRDPDLVAMERRAQSYSSSTKYFIMVNTYTHKVGIFKGKKNNWDLIHYWDCTTGAWRTPTIKGNFRVGSRGKYFDHDATTRLFWWTQIKGNYLFHSTLYTKDGRPKDSRLGMNLSMGCVRLAIENAKWIYDYIPTGTAIHID